MVIDHWLILNNMFLNKDNSLRKDITDTTVESLYREHNCTYPKFFKMDNLCKWAWLGSELLLPADEAVYSGLDKNKIGIVLSTNQGCIDVDRRFAASMSMPSPALFVYTLPNIMLGEICIRHGFKGEQLCMVNDVFDAEELHFNVTDFIDNKGMDAVLCGWVDVAGGKQDVCLYWVTKDGAGATFSSEKLSEIYNR